MAKSGTRRPRLSKRTVYRCPFGRPEKPDEPAWRGRGRVMEGGDGAGVVGGAKAWRQAAGHRVHREGRLEADSSVRR